MPVDGSAVGTLCFVSHAGAVLARESSLGAQCSAMLGLALVGPCAWQMAGPRRATADRRVLLRASEADAALWTLGLATAAYFSSYASEGYEPHRL